MVRTMARSVTGAPAAGGGGGGGGGTGAVSGEPVVVQNGGTMVANNFTTAQPFNMPQNFAGGNSVALVTAHFEGGGVGINPPVVGGVVATPDHTGPGSVSLLQYWHANNVPAGRKDIVITPTSAGTGHYISLNAVECSSIASFGVFAELNATSAAPGTGVTTAAGTQPAQLVMAAYRDDTGVNNVAATVVPADLTQGFLVRDGVSGLGGASGFKIAKRIQPFTEVFASTSTLWYDTVVTYNFAQLASLDGLLHQDWNADTAWHTPGTISVTPATTDLLVAFGAWWDDIATTSALPTDNHGTFIAAYNPSTVGGEPVACHVYYQATPSNQLHTITPPAIGDGGDGYFGVLRIPGIVGGPIRDIGSTRLRHVPVLPPDPATIQSITATTAGSAAKVGDWAMFLVVMDPNSITNADVAFVPPPGWMPLANQFNCTDNIGFLACIAPVTTAGKISATATWTDNATFIAGAVIVIFSRS
jgi:hypothetical protein